MVFIPVNLHASCYFLYLSVHTNVEITLASHLLEKLTIMTFALSYERCKYKNTAVIVMIKN